MAPEQMAKGGTRLKPGLAACNLHHWMLNHQEIIENNKLYFCTLGGFLIYKLTGRHACHITNAAPTGFVDLTKLAWNPDIICAVGCADFIFPDILHEHEVCGYFSSSYGNIPVFPDIGDHQASVYGALGGLEEMAVISGGTAGIVSVVSKESTPGDHENRPYFNHCYLKTVTQLPGGRNLDVLIDFIEDIGKSIYDVSRNREDIWRSVTSTILNTTNNDNISDVLQVELGFFQGQQGVKHGRIDDIRPGNFTVGSLFMAAYENMADIYITALHKLTGSTVPIKKIILTGGSIHDNLFMKETIQKRSGIETIPSIVQNQELAGLLQLASKINSEHG
ncbi:hypothetical protein GC096_18720 [Paenibacillus sp. LMG 31461]|uniref:Carbohydrate kinase FGGY N-terminal domain-containing protein n=1 Tax=Paenibacillus plantarum TaxID=2654975 RepID=A0ABX1XC70_9BACL|nr:hypothetical protein [Paenibacillus plantarum]